MLQVAANSFIAQILNMLDRFEVSHFDSAVSNVEHVPKCLRVAPCPSAMRHPDM